ncbi:hypothetical protein [Paraburkholderia sp. BL9I2N2]|uniref:hypothetical protein n=1 Tax=Paraburkholderia sp. BL9I2N2 TaxID=1938809 RepID=UPI0010DDD3D3|nr:hypothetical protein [Paraburkholderia sp. BL9I2N2]TCK84123.1 hypothetical protein B0G74_8931 [Paraburkholderia sp. BL9I2N2]
MIGDRLAGHNPASQRYRLEMELIALAATVAEARQTPQQSSQTRSLYSFPKAQT